MLLQLIICSIAAKQKMLSRCVKCFVFEASRVVIPGGSTCIRLYRDSKFINTAVAFKFAVVKWWVLCCGSHIGW